MLLLVSYLLVIVFSFSLGKEFLYIVSFEVLSFFMTYLYEIPASFLTLCVIISMFATIFYVLYKINDAIIEYFHRKEQSRYLVIKYEEEE